MKKSSVINLVLPTILFVLIFNTTTAKASKIKVKKIKGTQAIVETSIPLEEGQTYELLTEEKVSEEVDYKSNILKTRKNSLSLGANLNFLRSDTYQSNNYDLNVRYGWNFSNLEMGAFVDLSSKDVGAGATTSVMGGGYFDYNLVANRDPRKIIYGVFGLLGFGSTSYPSSGSGGSSTLLEFNGGGFVTYFIGNNTTALRAEAYGIYQQVNTTTTSGSLTGFGGRGLLVFYF